MIPSCLKRISEAVVGTRFEGCVWLVGGAVRDEILGIPHEADYDLVTTESAISLARLLFELRVSSIAPVVYERFGTAMILVNDVQIELVTARRESYAEDSRKPVVEPAALIEDATRRDFTVNTLMRDLASWSLVDPLGCGLDDLHSRVLRTPLDPVETFHDDPLRILRAVRFRWKLGFEPAADLYPAIVSTRERLRIISNERIRDELVKMLLHPSASSALDDLMSLGLFDVFAPEFVALVDLEQGKWHHLDAWDHTLLVLRNVGSGDLILSLAALFHDIGKALTQTFDGDGRIRFIGHEVEGSDLTQRVLRRMKFSEDEISSVSLLVRNHMRLGHSSSLSSSGARRIVRDLGDLLPRLLDLVDADRKAHAPGAARLDMVEIRSVFARVLVETPRQELESPLSGSEIMEALGLPPGRRIGELKTLLTNKVLDGELSFHDKAGALALLRSY